jgi:hypothetical protein
MLHRMLQVVKAHKFADDVAIAKSSGRAAQIRDQRGANILE